MPVIFPVRIALPEPTGREGDMVGFPGIVPAGFTLRHSNAKPVAGGLPETYVNAAVKLRD